MPYVVTQACVDIKDRSCVIECPVDCIYEGDRMMYIHPDECIECGACEAVCPTSAIYYDVELPAEDENFRTVNADFFAELGSPRGAKKVGKAPDVPFVAALPPGGA
ncbi:ferredoxin [Rhodococcus wratislaviensis]|uniref:Ferredoxin n=1 Tax=Rhodococcus wratislaviensis NBRC 100605 TaxID=1219028 RepID=X0PW88_RHOWR|nr:ferredoxin [Rhodococcus wratislaviensis]GAF47609.1 putative 7Fe ferredoxin [Rhodococcus wratislaviensis NBRC 100605]